MCRLAQAVTNAASKTRADAAAALLGARQAVAALTGRDEEVSLSDLHSLAAERMMRALAWAVSREDAAAHEGCGFVTRKVRHNEPDPGST